METFNTKICFENVDHHNFETEKYTLFTQPCHIDGKIISYIMLQTFDWYEDHNFTYMNVH